MKNLKSIPTILIVTFYLLLSTFNSSAQNVGINATGVAPDQSAMLDVVATNKGLLIPRVTLTQTVSNAPIGVGIATSVMVYNTATINDVTPGYYYWDGTLWKRIQDGPAGGSNDWTILGNAGTIDGTNFIGTTDNIPFNIRVNNQRAGRIENNQFTANTFFGFQAGNVNTTGGANTGIGYHALFSNTTGGDNTAIGARILFNNTTGSYNTASGKEALMTNTTGSSNIAFGSVVLTNNTTGNGNTATGNAALYGNTTGNSNIAIGENALAANNAGSNATAVGTNAMLYSNNASTAFTNTNVAVGFEALRGSSIAGNNIGNGNTALGYQTLWSNTTGNFNTTNGYQALYSNTIGSNNTALGYQTLLNNISGDINTAIGANALKSNTGGNRNTANGWQALTSNTLGDENTAVGADVLTYNITGNQNTAIGSYALSFHTTGNRNTAVGVHSLANSVSGNDNTAIGYFSDISTTSLSNTTAIGNTALVNANNKIRLGNAAVTVIEGQVAYTFPSDGRFKYNVKEEVKGLDFIIKLRPVTYQFDTKMFDEFLTKDMPDSIRRERSKGVDYSESSSIVHTGFIAQEVEAAAKISDFTFDGVSVPKDENGNYGVAYSQFVVPLVKAVQELNAKNENQQAIIESQQRAINQLIEDVKKLKNQ